MLLGSGGRASQVSGERTVFKRAARAEICPPVPVPPPLEKPILHHHRRHLEHTFFSNRFSYFSAILPQNFAKFQQNLSDSLRYENLDITLSEIIKILRNPGKNPLKFDEKLRNLLSPKKISKNCVKFAKKWCKGSEKSQKSGMVQR